MSDLDAGGGGGVALQMSSDRICVFLGLNELEKRYLFSFSCREMLRVLLHLHPFHFKDINIEL